MPMIWKMLVKIGFGITMTGWIELRGSPMRIVHMLFWLCRLGPLAITFPLPIFFVLLVSRRLLMPVRLAQMQWLSIILKRSFPLLIDCIANIVRSCFCPCQIMPKFQHCLFPHMRWLDDHTDVDCDVYDLSFEELALTLAASDFSFPLWKPQTGRMELVSLSTRYEKATLSSLFFCIRQSFRVLRSCCEDFDAVLLDRHHNSAPWGTPPVWWIFYSLAACHHSIGLQPINCLHNVPAHPQTEWFGQAGGLRPKTRTGGTAAAVPLLRMNLRAIEVP